MLKRLIWWLLIVIGCVGILATVAALFVTSGVNIGTVLPGMAGVVLLAYGIFRVKHEGPLFRNKAIRIVVTAVIFLGLAVFCFVEALIISAACAGEPEEEAGVVVVLGCGIFPDGRLSLSLKTRLDAAYDYLESHLDTLCVVTGGQGSNEPRPRS